MAEADSDDDGEPMSQSVIKRPVCIPYFKVKRHSEDYKFLKQITNDEVRWFDQYNFPEEDVDNRVKEQVIRTLMEFPNLVFVLKIFHKISQSVDDYGFYHSVIRATLELIFLFYTKECLYKGARHSKLCRELNKLWKDIGELGKKARPADEVCNSLIRHTIDYKRYPFVTEGHLAHLISSYESSVGYPCIFDNPHKHFFPRKNKDSISCDIEATLDRMDSSSRWMKVDDYTRLMTMFVREIVGYEEKFIDKGLEMVDIDALNSLVEKLQLSSYKEDLIPSSKAEILNYLEYHFTDLIYNVKKRMKQQVVDVMFSLFSLYNHDSLSIHPNVYEVIEVAELRRLALGSRFIRRNHLMWAFYECGYGLPPEITKMMKINFANEDHPPYHIYLASIKLAKCFEEKILQLEHFVFAVLYAKDKDISIDEMRVVEMREQFKEFMNEVDLDRMKRPKVIDNKQKDIKGLVTFLEMANLRGD